MNTLKYNCKKCRKTLFSEDDVFKHSLVNEVKVIWLKNNKMLNFSLKKVKNNDGNRGVMYKTTCNCGSELFLGFTYEKYSDSSTNKQLYHRLDEESFSKS